MKKIINSLLLFISVSSCFAECDWKTDIVRKGDEFTYTAACHDKVGKMVKELEDRRNQVTELNKTVELKDLFILKQDERILIWRNATYEVEDRFLKYDNMKKYNDVMYFGGGILVAMLGVWGAGQLKK
jgi:hypothetical protein